MDRKACRLVVFDWDGTLMDSEARIVACMRAAIADLSLEEREHAALSNIIGLGMAEAIHTLYPDMDLLTRQAFVDRYRLHFLTENPTPSELFAGARDTLEHLEEAGYLLAIATGKGRQGLDKALQETGLARVFHTTRCADEAHSKPHPQMLEDILEVLGVEPGEAVMVGDTEYDMLMARNADVDAVGVSYGVHEPRRLHQHDPLTVIDRISDLPQWLHLLEN